MKRHEHIVRIQDGEWLHLVEDVPDGLPKGVVVISHGLTGDRTGPQRILSQLSSELAEAGMVSIRFDYRGSGDSSGLFFKTTFTEMQKDMMFVLRLANQKHSGLPIGALGLSIGGVTAALCATESGMCSSLALISSDLIENVNFLVSGDVPIRNGHFYINEEFFRERENLYPRTRLVDSRLKTLIAYGGQDLKVKEAVRDLQGLNITIKEFPGVDHLFEDCSARKKLYQEVIHYFLNQYKGE
jgi:alpha/beta superfamily hydrolase